MAVYFDCEDAMPERSIFMREAEYFVIDRTTPTTVVIRVSDAAPQTMHFAQPMDALFFENDIESDLARTGWTLVKCEPLRVLEPIGEVWHERPKPTATS